jgi:hypothetical protein
VDGEVVGVAVASAVTDGQRKKQTFLGGGHQHAKLSHDVPPLLKRHNARQAMLGRANCERCFASHRR